MALMLLLPFVPIMALIVQNTATLASQLCYHTEVNKIGQRVAEIKTLEGFITNLQSERAEVAMLLKIILVPLLYR